MVGNKQVHIDQKMHIIEEWSIPMGLFELRSFLGLVNYYHKAKEVV
ncbi:unnamed protein product [Spirodela intermedia]|uniref:Uncharacterized protein n=2 Tax=Spirodela intermedia TaxID=51605 RepID=A0A7I8L7U8_SPIIN|nr:unnamed protein product [Spirodela intermedia]CAA6669172.1 unnamed protein product [Spirodela intermedia]CAA7406121.1 unnamed protein product [Spirodela intermedia]